LIEGPRTSPRTPDQLPTAATAYGVFPVAQDAVVAVPPAVVALFAVVAEDDLLDEPQADATKAAATTITATAPTRDRTQFCFTRFLP
jgi:hypothetical protein